MADDPDKAVSFGPYELIGRLGEGGMCHVFRARRKSDGRMCALKLLKEDQRSDERVLDLFITEADLSLMLEHPNLIQTMDAGEAKGRYYIAMELIEGANLDEIHRYCERIGVSFPPDFAMYVINEVLEGLEALHTATAKSGRELGLVHRDVTPSNVFVSFDGRVILGDFGIAHIMAYGDTESGSTVGKIGYLAPEVISGDGIDRRADIFAVGIILWELLTGQRLFSGADDRALMQAIAEGSVPRPRKLEPNMARGLENVVLKALTRRPKDRFQTAEEMAYELEPYWSDLIGNPVAMGGFMTGLLPEAAQKWRKRRESAARKLD